MRTEIMDGLARELDAVVSLLGSHEGHDPGASDQVSRLRFNAQRLNRRFRLLGSGPVPWLPGPEAVDLWTLLSLALRPLSRECKRRGCALSVDVGPARHVSVVAGQAVDAILGILEDALHLGASFIDLSVREVHEGVRLGIRTDAEMTQQSLSIMLVEQLAARLSPLICLAPTIACAGVVTLRVDVQALWLGPERSQAREERPTTRCGSPTADP